MGYKEYIFTCIKCARFLILQKVSFFSQHISKKRMAESSTRKVSRTDSIKEDRISVLPRNLQETILCLLPIRDAVRTSILSKNWRNCWTTIPNLAFDEHILCEKSRYFSGCHGPELKALKFVSVINKVLQLHNGPILKFSLCYPDFCNARIIHDYTDRWIPLFSRKGIKQLSLEGSFRETFTALNFSSLALTHLGLAYTLFPYTPAFGGLTYLRIIELVDVSTSEQNVVFNCPVLEKLTLLYCEGLLPINFRAPNLKCLRQIYDEITSEYFLAGFESLTEFSCRLLYDPEMLPETSNVVKVFGSLHKIEKISIAQYFITYLAAGGSPTRFPHPLPYLKTLSFSDIYLTSLPEVFCLLCLIRSAPNLCRLHVTVRWVEKDAVEGNLQDYSVKVSKDFTIDQLEIVTFYNLQGLRTELDLIKFILAHSPMLKTMYIHYSITAFEKDVATTMTKEMLQYSKTSSGAQIIHLKKIPSNLDDY